MRQNQDYTCSSKSQEETADLWISCHTLIHVSRHICFSTDKCHLWRKNDIDTCIWLTRLPTILEVYDMEEQQLEQEQSQHSTS